MRILPMRQVGRIHTAIRKMPTLQTHQVLQQRVPKERVGVPPALVRGSQLAGAATSIKLLYRSHIISGHEYEFLHRSHIIIIGLATIPRPRFIYAAYCKAKALGCCIIFTTLKVFILNEATNRIPSHITHTQTDWLLATIESIPELGLELDFADGTDEG